MRNDIKELPCLSRVPTIHCPCSELVWIVILFLQPSILFCTLLRSSAKLECRQVVSMSHTVLECNEDTKKWGENRKKMEHMPVLYLSGPLPC